MPSPHSLGVHRLLSPLKPLRQLLDYPPQRRLAAAINIADLRQCASSRAHKMVFDYIDGAAEDEITLNRNRSAYSDLELQYTVLAGHKEVDLSASLFGRELSLPFFCAPTAGQRMFHYEGEEAAARVCSDERTLFCLSALGTTGLDEVAAINPGGAKCLQLYLWKDRELMRDVLQRAKAAGFHAIALTANTAVFGNRERDPRNGFSVPPDYTSVQQAVRALLAPAWTFDFLSNEPFYYKVRASPRAALLLPLAEPPLCSAPFPWSNFPVAPPHPWAQPPVRAVSLVQGLWPRPDGRVPHGILQFDDVEGLLVGRCRVAAFRVGWASRAQGCRLGG